MQIAPPRRRFTGRSTPPPVGIALGLALTVALTGALVTADPINASAEVEKTDSSGGSPGPGYVIYYEPDGFDPRYLEWYDTPNIDDLVRRGSFSVADGIVKASSNPGRYSIITGAYPEVTGQQSYYYDWDRDEVIRQDGPHDEADHGEGHPPLKAESIGEVVRDEYDDINLAAIGYFKYAGFLALSLSHLPGD
jgi:hypothetical protein